MSYAEFRDRLAEGIDTRFYTIEYLDWMIFSGRAAFWCAESAAIVAEIKVFPTGVRAVAGVVATGPKAQIVGLIPHAEAWGRQHGCQFGMIESREGWGRTMKQHGYQHLQTAIVKEL